MTHTFTAIVADDEANARESMILVASRYTPKPYEIQLVDTISDFSSLTQSVSKWAPDLLFLDIQMNNNNSLDWLESELPAKTAVIIVSAYDRFALRALRLSVFDYLVKPVDPIDYAAAITRFASKKMHSTDVESRLAWTSIVSASIPEREHVLSTLAQIPPEFMVHCLQTIPSITNQELRVLHLQKAGFIPKDIARILGIEAASVKKIKQRLNRKSTVEKPKN